MSARHVATMAAFGSLALAVPSLTSCRSEITGNEGNLEFSYVADDDLLDFNKPLAVGASLDLRVTPAGTMPAQEFKKGGRRPTDRPEKSAIVPQPGYNRHAQRDRDKPAPQGIIP